MQIDLTQIIIALIGLLATVATCYIIPYLKTKTSEERWDYLCMVASTAVYAAEQLGVANKFQTKLDYAFTYVKTILAAQNIHFNNDIIRAAIEAAVYEIKNMI
jgi:LL-H family phage holin